MTFIRMYNVDILRSNDNVHRFIWLKSIVYTLKFMTCKFRKVIFTHNTVKNIAFSYKIRNKCILRLIIYILRSTYLLNCSFVHYNNCVGHRKSFFLVMRNKYKSDTGFLLNLLKFRLHIFSEF